MRLRKSPERYCIVGCTVGCQFRRHLLRPSEDYICGYGAMRQVSLSSSGHLYTQLTHISREMKQQYRCIKKINMQLTLFFIHTEPPLSFSSTFLSCYVPPFEFIQLRTFVNLFCFQLGSPFTSSGGGNSETVDFRKQLL